MQSTDFARVVEPVAGALMRDARRRSHVQRFDVGGTVRNLDYLTKNPGGDVSGLSTGVPIGDPNNPGIPGLIAGLGATAMGFVNPASSILGLVSMLSDNPVSGAGLIANSLGLGNIFGSHPTTSNPTSGEGGTGGGGEVAGFGAPVDTTPANSIANAVTGPTANNVGPIAAATAANPAAGAVGSKAGPVTSTGGVVNQGGPGAATGSGTGVATGVGTNAPGGQAGGANSPGHRTGGHVGALNQFAKGGHAKGKSKTHVIVMMPAPEQNPTHKVLGALALAALINHARKQAALHMMARGAR